MFNHLCKRWANSPIYLYSTRNLHRMKDHKITPEVIQNPPKEILEVRYGDMKVDMGNTLLPAMVQNKPTVRWKYEKGAFYTLCMTDPDAPSREKPRLREFHHWLVGNIPGNEINEGDELTEYIGAMPTKRSGYHRYVFLLYKQPSKIQFTEPHLTNLSAEGRSRFSIQKFAEKYKLGDPLAGNFFLGKWDKSVIAQRRRLSRIQTLLSKLIAKNIRITSIKK